MDNLMQIQSGSEMSEKNCTVHLNAIEMPHILENIFVHLNLITLKRCRLVSRLWNTESKSMIFKRRYSLITLRVDQNQSYPKFSNDDSNIMLPNAVIQKIENLELKFVGLNTPWKFLHEIDMEAALLGQCQNILKTYGKYFKSVTITFNQSKVDETSNFLEYPLHQLLTNWCCNLEELRVIVNYVSMMRLYRRPPVQLHLQPLPPVPNHYDFTFNNILNLKKIFISIPKCKEDNEPLAKNHLDFFISVIEASTKLNQLDIGVSIRSPLISYFFEKINTNPETVKILEKLYELRVHSNHPLICLYAVKGEIHPSCSY